MDGLLFNLKAVDEISVPVLVITVFPVHLIGDPFVSDLEVRTGKRADLAQVSSVMMMIGRILAFFRHALQHFFVDDQAIGFWHQLQIFASLTMHNGHVRLLIAIDSVLVLRCDPGTSAYMLDVGLLCKRLLHRHNLDLFSHNFLRNNFDK